MEPKGHASYLYYDHLVDQASNEKMERVRCSELFHHHYKHELRCSIVFHASKIRHDLFSQ